LTLHFSSKTQARLDSLVTTTKDDSAKIQHLQDQLEHLGQGLSIESLTPNAQNQLRLLLGLSERACDVIAQHRILESLAFEGMYGRYEDVDEAHLETLRWIYGDDLYTDEEDEDSADYETYKEDEAGDIDEDEYEDEEKTSARELLLNWISSGAGIFHISGKLGSGKSTLMKYLSDHNCTGELLGQWAGSSLRYFISIVPRTNYYNKANVN
jgi:type II secretory pathway predicted ATPase ExeA